ncbi:MAG: hypothetical protein ACRD8U_08145 [Pyrinomonadaceae bacterium]
MKRTRRTEMLLMLLSLCLITPTTLPAASIQQKQGLQATEPIDDDQSVTL